MAARKRELNVLGSQKQLQSTESLVSRITFFSAPEQKTEQLATAEFLFFL